MGCLSGMRNQKCLQLDHLPSHLLLGDPGQIILKLAGRFLGKSVIQIGVTCRNSAEDIASERPTQRKKRESDEMLRKDIL